MIRRGAASRSSSTSCFCSQSWPRPPRRRRRQSSSRRRSRRERAGPPRASAPRVRFVFCTRVAVFCALLPIPMTLRSSQQALRPTHNQVPTCGPVHPKQTSLCWRGFYPIRPLLCVPAAWIVQFYVLWLRAFKYKMREPASVSHQICTALPRCATSFPITAAALLLPRRHRHSCWSLLTPPLLPAAATVAAPPQVMTSLAMATLVPALVGGIYWRVPLQLLTCTPAVGALGWPRPLLS